MLSFINSIILTSTLKAIQEGDFNFCYRMGFTENEITKLANISADELIILCRMSNRFMVYTIDHDIFNVMLDTSAEEMSRQQRINRAISLGGSIALLHHFFGLTSNEVCSRRRLLAVNVPYGRTPTPNEIIDAKIWQYWKAENLDSADSLDGLAVMMNITESLSSMENNPTLTAVWKRVSTFSDTQDRRKTANG